MSIYLVVRDGPGRLAIVSRPTGSAPFATVGQWKQKGYSLVVSLLEAHEAHQLNLGLEGFYCQPSIEFVEFPIADRGVPDSMAATLALVDRIVEHIGGGGRAAVHCRASIGRSGLLAACVLVRRGESVSDAFAIISKARGVQCPDTAEQIAWVEQFEAYLADLPPDPFKAAGPASDAPR